MKLVPQVAAVQHKLIRWDEAGDTVVHIRPARHGDEAERRKLWSQVKVNRLEGLEIYDSPTNLDSLECWLTFESSNISDSESKPMFRPGMSQAEFVAAFNKLPVELADEWHEAVRQVNPHWGYGGEVSKN